MAAAASAAFEAWKRPTTSRVSAGLTLSKVRPVTLSHHSPPMKLPWVVGAAAPVASGVWSISWLIGGFYARCSTCRQPLVVGPAGRATRLMTMATSR